MIILFLVFVTLFIFRVEKLTGLPREIVEGAESLQVSLSTTHPNIMIFTVSQQNVTFFRFDPLPRLNFEVINCIKH